jgi:ABC-type Na+ efflux pump permease subunit
MEPIISPWIIYVIRVLSSLHDIAMVFLTISCILAIIMFLLAIFEEAEELQKYLKMAVIIAAVCGGVAIIIPDKDTMIAMMAVSYITPDNIQLVQGNIVDFVRQISEAVQNGK